MQCFSIMFNYPEIAVFLRLVWHQAHDSTSTENRDVMLMSN